MLLKLHSFDAGKCIKIKHKLFYIEKAKMNSCLVERFHAVDILNHFG